MCVSHQCIAAQFSLGSAEICCLLNVGLSAVNTPIYVGLVQVVNSIQRASLRGGAPTVVYSAPAVNWAVFCLFTRVGLAYA